MTSTMTSFAQSANLEVKVIVKRKISLGGRAEYGITLSKLEILE